MLLTLCYYHRGTRLNAIKRFCHSSLCSHQNVLTVSPPVWAMLRSFRYVQIFLQTSFGISRAAPTDSDCCVAFPRPALSAATTTWTNHAPMSFDQHIYAQVPQGHVMPKKEQCITDVHGGGGLGLVKPAREAASSRPKPFASLKNLPGNLPVRRSVSPLVGRKQAVMRDQLSPQKLLGSRL